MAIQTLKISLNAVDESGAKLRESDFLIPLNLEDDKDQIVVSSYPGGGKGEQGFVSFYRVQLSDFQDDDEYDTEESALIEATIVRLSLIADWIKQRSSVLLEVGSKLSLTLWINLRIDEDQIELMLPPTFLAACGEAEINVCLVSQRVSTNQKQTFHHGN